MLYISYDEAVDVMARGLEKRIPEETARRFARVFAENSLDGVYSHGINRYLRYLSDIDKGLCDPSVTEAEKVSGFGALEAWDAHCGIGPLMADQMTDRAVELAKEHGIACVALRNNSHWLRAGRYGLRMAEAGMAGLCFTNTCMNLSPWGAMQPAIGNNPFCMALPRKNGPLLLDMAVSQYAYGKLELMAQQGKMLDEPCGYDSEGNETCDPKKIIESGLMVPMAKWKGNALSIMLDLTASMLSLGRTTLSIGLPEAGERGVSQVFIAINPRALGEGEEAERQMEETIAFLGSLAPRKGDTGIHAPGLNREKTRRNNETKGIPVEEETWLKIVKSAGLSG